MFIWEDVRNCVVLCQVWVGKIWSCLYGVSDTDDLNISIKSLNNLLPRYNAHDKREWKVHVFHKLLKSWRWEKQSHVRVLQIRWWLLKWLLSWITAWNVSKYGVFSGTYFPVFWMNKEIYSVNHSHPNIVLS